MEAEIESGGRALLLSLGLTQSMWFIEQVECYASGGRRGWLGASSTSTSLGWAAQAGIRVSPGVIFPSYCDGDWEPLNLPLTSVLPFNDGWHLRDWNCTVWVWHAFPYFQWVSQGQSRSRFKAFLQISQNSLQFGDHTNSMRPASSETETVLWTQNEKEPCVFFNLSRFFLWWKNQFLICSFMLTWYIRQSIAYMPRAK